MAQTENTITPLTRGQKAARTKIARAALVAAYEAAQQASPHHVGFREHVSSWAYTVVNAGFGTAFKDVKIKSGTESKFDAQVLGLDIWGKLCTETAGYKLSDLDTRAQTITWAIPYGANTTGLSGWIRSYEGANAIGYVWQWLRHLVTNGTRYYVTTDANNAAKPPKELCDLINAIQSMIDTFHHDYGKPSGRATWIQTPLAFVDLSMLYQLTGEEAAHYLMWQEMAYIAPQPDIHGLRVSHDNGDDFFKRAYLAMIPMQRNLIEQVKKNLTKGGNK